MKLEQLKESDKIIDFAEFKKQKRQTDFTDVEMQSIHAILNIEPAEDELAELEHFFKEALDSFVGKKSDLMLAMGLYRQNIDVYQDARDDEDFEKQDAAYDQIVKSIGLLGGKVEYFE